MDTAAGHRRTRRVLGTGTEEKIAEGLCGFGIGKGRSGFGINGSGCVWECGGELLVGLVLRLPNTYMEGIVLPLTVGHEDGSRIYGMPMPCMRTLERRMDSGA